MIKLSKNQMFSLMFIFEVGSTTLFALGIDAKQDAWIVILVALLIGIVFIWIYTELQSAFPDKNFAEIIISILGEKIGIPLAMLYAVYWLWPAARNLREFGELINNTLLPETPLYVILTIFILTSLYALLEGLEVFARTSELIMPVITFSIIALFVMIFISVKVDFNNLKPVLEKGLMPVFEAAYPNVSLFPFGEILIFSMYWCYADEKKAVRKTTMLAAILTGVLLSMTLVMNITVLGVKYTSLATIPLLQTIRLVNIGNLITHIDALGIILMFFGGFYKMSLFLNGVVLVISTILKIKKYNFILVVASFFLLWVSIVFEPSYAYHKWMTPFDTDYFYIVFLQIIPTLLLLIYWVKKMRSQL
jgi:spore germination protein KB